jgi:V/A-type H+/Na+-transporting ATPase subunit I
MIAPMKRAFVVLLERDKKTSLRELRRLGVLHVEALPGSGAAYDSRVAAKADLVAAIGFLSEFKAKVAGGPLGLDEGIALAKEICGIASDIKSAIDEQVAIIREIERVRPWGDFDPLVFSYLAEKGLKFRAIEVEAKKLAFLPPELEYLMLERNKVFARILVIGDNIAALPTGCTEFGLPARGLSTLETSLVEIKARVADGRKRLAAKAPFAKPLGDVLAKVEREVQFEALHSGMPDQGTLSYSSAWVPIAEEKRLAATAAREGWGLLIDEPLSDELPPTKIENPAIVRIIQPVFDFLGTVPNYREYDISALFLAFFTIFFAMIFGDGGYGSLLLLGAIFMALKAKKKSGKVPDAIRLMLLLASATVAWGIATASWFGLPAEILPGFLKAVSIPQIASYNPASGANVKIVCFALGTVHLLIARLKNLIRDRKSLKLLAQLGMLLQLAGMYFIVLNLVLDAVRFPIPGFALYLIAVGFVLNFVFANYEGNIIKSILASLANIVSVFLGVVNVFADITSYIRLWAVGLAGVAISQTVNSMAGPMLGKALLFVMGVALLGFGHGLNIVLSVLSVVVHGVRLNMLEFSGHLGMEWSGYAYDPFSETVHESVVEIERGIS